MMKGGNKMFGGYNWYYGKSNRAVRAEENGLFPISKLRKKHLEEEGIGFTVKEAKILAKFELWKPCEWHHTSKFYNKTYYYCIDDLLEIWEDEELRAEAWEWIEVETGNRKKEKEALKEAGG